MSATEIRVSIVTPFLNAARFFEESVESVLAQTYQHWELLLVDDGSFDGSAEIAERYATAHPDRIRYLAHPSRTNQGASASRNLGARHARGEYLAYLDADDVYLPAKLQEQVPLLDAHPDVMFTGHRSVGSIAPTICLSDDRRIPVLRWCLPVLRLQGAPNLPPEFTSGG